MPEISTKCPHCQAEMKKWEPPEDSTWTSALQYVCFNDECPYYLRGWEHIKKTQNVTASYRHRLDPQNGDNGPLPVWSKEAQRDRIIED